MCEASSCPVLRSEIPSSMCAKLRTMAASNNRDHARNISYYCLLALHIWWCYSSRTSRSWWITQTTQYHQGGCNYLRLVASLIDLCPPDQPQVPLSFDERRIHSGETSIQGTSGLAQISPVQGDATVATAHMRGQPKPLGSIDPHSASGTFKVLVNQVLQLQVSSTLEGCIIRLLRWLYYWRDHLCAFALLSEIRTQP